MKSLCLRPKAVNARTKAFFRGQLELQPGSVAIKKIQGMTDDMVEITDHPFLTLMDDVNPWEEGYAFRYSQYADLQIFGRYYTLLAGEGEPPTEMWRLLPQRVKVKRDAVDFVGGYEYGFGTDKQTFSIDEVLWHKLFDPTDPWGGKGPLESWLKAIDADFAIEAFQEWLFARGGTPDYVIKHKAVMTSTQKSDFLAEWRRKFGELARRVTTISFTGGTATGEVIARAAAPKFKKIALELGGKNPNIIFADADFEEVIPASLRSSFANQGQVCLCGSRIFVEQQRYDEFVERFVTATRKLKIGDPLEESTDHGAQVSQAQLDKVRYYVELAKDEGGEILCGGRQPEAVSERCKNGYFFEPTVITGLGVECRVNQEEIFGPVVTIMPFESEDQVADYANSTKYGLSASIWTQNLTRAHRLAERIDSGTVWVNCWMLRDLRVPFGGMKSSGVGREGGAEAMRFFTEPKNVCIKI
ncbi:MAG: aldehyde dehydrogenase family protein [Planctomycetes bacterium]|nr:aldehyde dehydrogenase family protein [Planctomycetota bacterium]